MAGNSNRNNAGSGFDPGIVARVSGMVRYAVTGKVPDWFGPSEPIAPVAPPGTEGRQFDYPTGYNLSQRPRSNDPVTFEQMRALADSLDILRLVIESRKDQIAAQKFTFKPKDDEKEPDDRCKALEEFFALPDKEHTWADWLRMVMEDMLVLDAPTIYPRKTVGGGIYAFEPIDGATIKRVIDGTGRTPIAGPAYQQILKGMPAIDYTRDELVYKPRNPRTNRVYGYSPVEQIIMTVNIAIRRQLSQLSYYTDGSTPDLIFSVPETWNTAAIKEFHDWWNEMLAGNIKKKRGTMFVPKGVDPVNTKEAILTDKYDEWLARIICYAFSISPQPFIQQINRATAETAQETAVEEGLLPLMNWVKNLVDYLIFKYFGYTDIEFSWVDSTELDPLVKAQVAKIYKDIGSVTADEIRHRDLSLPPLTPEQKEELKPTPPPMALPGTPGGEDEPPGKKLLAPKITKGAKIKKINRERRAVTVPRAKLKKAIQVAFAKSLSAVIADLSKSAPALITKGKEEDPKKKILKELDDLYGDIEEALVPIAVDGASKAFAQINYDVDDALNQANETAVEWARNRAAELVGKKFDDSGNLIDNPDVTYRISDSTREGINALVTQATDEGWTNDELATALQESYAFSDARADMIARTETAMADTAGNMIAYRESGVVMGKQWLLAPDSCDDCKENADVGVIDLDDLFPDGSDTAPAHPHCVCDCAPVVKDED